MIQLIEQTVPNVSFGAGKVVIRQIALKKIDLPWSELWAYYAMLPWVARTEWRIP